jgi:hypothetical protein
LGEKLIWKEKDGVEGEVYKMDVYDGIEMRFFNFGA